MNQTLDTSFGIQNAKNTRANEGQFYGTIGKGFIQRNTQMVNEKT
jgi:hypothetical protein